VIQLSTRLIRHGLLICLISSFVSATLADSTNSAWFTRVWQTDDGLPNNQVTSIVQGRDGYLWVGTAVGLARFDGIHFTPFSYLDSNSNEDQGVIELLPSRAGGLWIRSRRGAIVCLSPDFSKTSIPAAKSLPTDKVLATFEDKDGCLWIAYPDSIWQVKNGRATRFADYQNMSSSGIAGRFANDSDGNLWFTKGVGVYLLRNGQFETVTNTPYRAHLETSRSKGVWIASGKQLFKCDTNGELRDCGSFYPEDSHAGSTVVLEDHTGAVWIGTSSGGLFRYSESGFEKIETSHLDILSLAEDREGNLWVGTAGGGLDRINTRSVQLESLNTGPSPAPIQSICEDDNSRLWGVTQNGLLVSRVNGQWIPALTNAPWVDAVDCVAADRSGALWIGARNSGLYCLRDGQFFNWGTDNGFTGHVVLALLPAATGDLWIAEQAPVALQCLHKGQLLSLKIPRNIGRITALAEDAAGTIWVGSEMGALLRVESGNLVDASALVKSSPRSILCLYPTADGSLWIGYEGTGLGRLKDGHFNQIQTGQGLADGYISQMVADDEGWLWFAGEHGIFKVRHRELELAMDGQADRVRSISYGQNEGLFSVEADSANVSPYIFPVALHSHDDRLWLPLRKALAVVDPKILNLSTEPPSALLSQVTMDGQTIASYGGLDTAETIANLCSPDLTLRLPPTHRHLEFNFTALSFNAPENIRFRFRLDGLDNDWVDATTRSASYSRLSAGNYAFRVEASSGNGLWNKAGIPLSVVVTPFFWQTWWFRFSLLAFFTFSVIAVARYVSFRRLRRRFQALAQQAALDKERTRIARDLHDDLGGSLTQVKQLFELALRNHASPEKMSHYLRRGLAKTQYGIKSLDETVWAVNPHNDSLPHLIDYIGQASVEFLHAADIRCRADLPPNPPERIISVEARHNLFLAVKEALTNVVRHAHASEVQLQAGVTEESLTLTIKDNGKGFEPAPAAAGADGLRNMQQRMAEIGGRFHIQSQIGAGTTISLTYFWAARKF